MRSFFRENIEYCVKCPDCPTSSVGEAGRGLQERVDDMWSGWSVGVQKFSNKF